VSARHDWLRRALLLLGVAAPFGGGVAAGLDLPQDGWVSWTVDTVAAPAWCCFEWKHRESAPALCRLDGPNQGYGSSDRDAKVTSMRVYARFDDGRLAKLRALAATCPVETATPVRALDGVAADASRAWLVSVISPRRNSLSDDAMAALAVHAGPAAHAALATIARSDASTENRKQAMFWATQVRGVEGLRMVLPFLASDPDARVREHAAFAVAQTRTAEAVAALAKQAREDASTKVRAQAWFWLAQTGAADAEALIRTALARETSQQVREQAVFALSQLPEPANVAALVRVAEDRALGQHERKQAIFWLGQSESDEALKYLDKLLL
jgi:HEAT repeat protein